MTNFMKVVREAEEASGAGSKKVIMEALGSADVTAQWLLKEALDPYRVFGVKKFPMPKVFQKAEDKSDAITRLTETLNALADRRLTGNAARDAVTEALSYFSEEDAEILARIIGKDLKAGFSADTVNKVFPDLVPTFNVMLAGKYDTDEEVRANIVVPCLAEAKYDGERTIAIVTANSVNYYSRSGKEAKHCDGLFDKDLLAMRDEVGEDIVVDGERYASDFTETMNAKKEGGSKAKDNLRFYTFFMMTLSEWKAKKCKRDMDETRTWLERIIAVAKCTKVFLSKGEIIKDFKSLETFYHQMVKMKFEGLIIKQLTASYEWDRSNNWIKWKPFFDFDGEIIGFYGGRSGTRLENTLGGITIKGTDEQGREVLTNVGSGFSDEMRKYIWDNQENFLGKTVTVKYQEISKAKDSEYYALRFPTFSHMRDDK